MAVAFLGHHFLLTFHFYKDFYTTQQAKNPSPTELFWSFQSRNQILSILLWCTQLPNAVHTSMAKMYLDKDWFASIDLVRLLCFVISIKHPFSIVYIDCRTQLYHQRIAAHLWLCQIWLTVFKNKAFINGYIDVGDGCWRRNVLVATNKRYLWRFLAIWVINIHKSSPT